MPMSMANPIARIPYLTNVDFGIGALSRLAEALGEAGIKRPLLITDEGLVRAGVAEQTTMAMGKHQPAAMFAKTPANPTELAVEAAAAQYGAAGCDGIVALGGGSPMDLAKAVALRVSHDGDLADFAAVTGGALRIGGAVAPVIAIPTTAGTGSEVGRATLIVMTDGRKLALISPYLLPKRALCDPELTRDLPPDLTAATGMDAVAHCVETYLSPVVNPPADAIALDGLSRALTHIERAVVDGGDQEARWQMMMAALQGGLCFPKGLGAVHALSHALGALTAPVLHHGTLNAVLLPPVLRFNEDAEPGKCARLRQAMGLAEDADLGTAIAALNARLGLPEGLGAMGVPAGQIGGLARAALEDLSTQTNPRTVTVADYEAILLAVW